MYLVSWYIRLYYRTIGAVIYYIKYDILKMEKPEWYYYELPGISIVNMHSVQKLMEDINATHNVKK